MSQPYYQTIKAAPCFIPDERQPHCTVGGTDYTTFNIEDYFLKPSPQPQQKQQKEDTMKPYAVIWHNLTAQIGAISGNYTTEAEAKEAAELLVASHRANLTTKQYFAVTIVNTKTGTLVGSVVDAPPAVDWKTE